MVACNREETEVENLPVVNKNRVSIGKKPVTTNKRSTEAAAAPAVVAAAPAAELEEQDEDEAFAKVVEKYTPVKKRTKRGTKGSPTHPIGGASSAAVKAEPDAAPVRGSRLSGGESYSLAGPSTASNSAAATAAVAAKVAAAGRGSRTANVASDSLFQAMR